jgi:shikimate kinase
MNPLIHADSNIILVGMPWSGKSTMGVVLAKLLARPFLDTDILIQTGEKRALQTIIDQKGANALQQKEEGYVLALNCRGHVIATGGSVVYSIAAIRHLKQNGCCIYLQVPLSEIEARATSIEDRGLVRKPGQTLADLYAERTLLYERYADITIHCESMNQAQVLDELMKRITATP